MTRPCSHMRDPGAEGEPVLILLVLLRPKRPLAERGRNRWGCVCYKQATTSRPVPPGILTGLGHAQNHVWS